MELDAGPRAIDTFQKPSRDDFQSPLLKQRYIILIGCTTVACISFTTFFALNGSLEHPLIPSLVFDPPGRSVLALNFASQLTIFFLAELIAGVLEIVRWALACSPSGISAFSFLILSRATNAAGTLYLLLKGGEGKLGIVHRVWGFQRIFFLILRLALGVLLLSDISFKVTYPGVYQFPVQNAGLPPLNTSVVDTEHFNATATASFWWYFPAFLTDSKRSRAVAPLNCSGQYCNSYFLPGSWLNAVPDPDLPPISATEYPKGTAFIQNDAPGYQVEFSYIDRVNDPKMTLDDCQLYGVDDVAFQICMKKAGHSLLTAWSSCPYSLQVEKSCLNTTDWRIIVPINTKLTIFSRRASTVFDRFNFTIIDIINLSDPTPVNYTPEDFFTFYNIVFAIDQTQQNWWMTTQYSFLLGISSALATWAVENGTGSDDQLSRLQGFLATPINLFNNAAYGGSTPDMGTSATLASTSYKLVIAPYTIYSFFTGGFISLIWCGIALATSLFVLTPNSSLFPEIDIASKVAPEEAFEAKPFAPASSLSELLWPLSNAVSHQIVNRLASTRFFVRFSENEIEENRRIVLTLQENGLHLARRKRGS